MIISSNNVFKRKIAESLFTRSIKSDLNIQEASTLRTLLAHAHNTFMLVYYTHVTFRSHRLVTTARQKRDLRRIKLLDKFNCKRYCLLVDLAIWIRSRFQSIISCLYRQAQPENHSLIKTNEKVRNCIHTYYDWRKANTDQ